MEAVDLGLSVKWATCNIGANKPEEYGNYFAWGETTPKDDYYWNTYKYGSDRRELTKYCTDSDYGKDGFVDNKTVLELADDAARANLGGAWRMPTKEEWTKLLEKCTWKWTTINGFEGYMVKSHINGNSIFLPAAGYRYKYDLSFNRFSLYYWSSSIDTDRPYGAWCLRLPSYEIFNCNIRYFGQSIRPVLSNN